MVWLIACFLVALPVDEELVARSLARWWIAATAYEGFMTLLRVQLTILVMATIVFGGIAGAHYLYARHRTGLAWAGGMTLVALVIVDLLNLWPQG